MQNLENILILKVLHSQRLRIRAFQISNYEVMKRNGKDDEDDPQLNSTEISVS